MLHTLEEDILALLTEHFSSIIARSILKTAIELSGCDIENLWTADIQKLAKEIQKGVFLYSSNGSSCRNCIEPISRLLYEQSGQKWHGITGSQTVSVKNESDIVVAREAGRDMCTKNGFRLAGQIKMATAISELARNIIQYAGSGKIKLSIVTVQGRRGIEIIAEDNGPGIRDVNAVLEGRYQSKTGLGKGLVGTRNLVDDFDITSSPVHGTRVTLRMYID